MSEFIQAWAGGGRPLTGPVPGYPGLNYSACRLYQHACGHVEDWSIAVGPIDEQGCDACESSPYPGSWQPLYRKADSYEPVDPHANCDTAARAGTEQTCDRCKRTLTVTPWDDFYCAAEGDHCCEACLVGDRPIAHIDPDAPLDEPVFRAPAGGPS